MDEDLFQHQIYILTFVESLKMIFSQYIETCEVLLDYSRVGGEGKNVLFKIPSGIFCMQISIYTAKY